MEDLEKRVKLCTDEKRQLEKKVNELEKRNSSLIGQLRKLQKLVTDGTRQTAKTGTCAMVSLQLVLCSLGIILHAVIWLCLTPFLYYVVYLF